MILAQLIATLSGVSACRSEWRGSRGQDRHILQWVAFDVAPNSELLWYFRNHRTNFECDRLVLLFGLYTFDFNSEGGKCVGQLAFSIGSRIGGSVGPWA